MKDYKRLTEEHINDAEFCSGCSFDDDLNGCEIGGCDKYYMYFETYEKLRKLEDKIESGELCDREESEWKHQTEVLRLALSKAVLDENAIFDDDVCKYILSNTKLTEEYYIEQAEKKLAEEERKDDNN